ncbi:MAG: M3 family oligoendopeptidase, partial [Alphaproteobacteria bacterium]|nr:M3 family oligoendopeptidase [Alphaproteobacteria bacterium]
MTRIYDKNEPGAASVLGDLPEWNLADLYSGPDAADLAADLATIDKKIAAFEVHRGGVANLDGSAFGQAIAEFEAIGDAMGRIDSFAQLYQSVDVADPARGRFFQNIVDRSTTLSSRLVFFTLEIIRMDDAVLAAKMSHPAAAKYAPWVRDLRVFRGHELSDDLEKILLDKSTTGRVAWVRLYDETLASMRVDV